ncbi:DUF3152 domain-containing protein [Streptomyces sp. RLB3-17]|uniref:DUF3152 domain-containing protein n=1 Tax=Streptomyces sp. RLB3-17 TaxID=2594455 RepID=UPI0011640C2C|nr:DUF3152 domain-containing protein [Streptomyces sp. RLB3-17]QDO42387.1 DUF3152 domain-containing protein [Streptomyces sp. RLB3-17]
MGRHSRRGRAGKSDTGELPRVPAPGAAPGTAQGVAPGTGPAATSPQGATRGPLGPQPPGPRRPTPTGTPRPQDGTPAHGFPRLPDGTPAHGFPRMASGAPAQGVPRPQDGTPAQGVPRYPDGTPAHGFPRLPDGTPAHGFPRLPDGTPAHGVPRFADGTPARGVPQARAGHPEQREPGGGWGAFTGGPRTAGATDGGPQGAPQGMPQGAPGPRIPRQRQEADAGLGPGPGLRQAYVDAFDESEGSGERPGTDESGTEEAEKGKGAKGRAFTGIAAAAVTTVLAVVVAGQVAAGRHDATAQTQSAAGGGLDARASASPGDTGSTPSVAPSAAPLTYDQKMGVRYPLSATLKASGKFDAVPGFDKAPGKGQKYTYRVDVEKGLGLDVALFAQAVQKTLNDKRSWAHNGARTFERISSGTPDFVITLASPGTTAEWCAKSGLDTTEDNVSCDSASTERVMINAYRWAQGSKTYGDAIHPYRQMLINHEVGHRLGYGHVTCDKDGELAPVMQQQTKFLDHDGIHCLANPWPYPGS